MTWKPRCNPLENAMSLNQPFPTEPNQMELWAEENRRSIVDGELRYAHYLALRSIVDDPVLRDVLVLHGGAVAAYAFGAGRTPKDIDLFVRGRRNETFSPEERQDYIRRTGGSLSVGTRKFCPDFDVWGPRLREKLHVELYGPTMDFGEIELRLCPNDPAVTVRATDLSSTIAGKYCSLLRPPESQRRTGRRQVVFDLASMIQRLRYVINHRSVLASLKSDPPPSLQQAARVDDVFTAEVKQLGEMNYDGLRPLTRDQFIAFPEAWNCVREYFSELTGLQ